MFARLSVFPFFFLQSGCAADFKSLIVPNKVCECLCVLFLHNCAWDFKLLQNPPSKLFILKKGVYFFYNLHFHTFHTCPLCGEESFPNNSCLIYLNDKCSAFGYLIGNMFLTILVKVIHCDRTVL